MNLPKCSQFLCPPAAPQSHKPSSTEYHGMISLIQCCSIWTESGFKIAKDHAEHKGDKHSILIYYDDAGAALEALPRK